MIISKTSLDDDYKKRPSYRLKTSGRWRLPETALDVVTFLRGRIVSVTALPKAATSEAGVPSVRADWLAPT